MKNYRQLTTAQRVHESSPGVANPRNIQMLNRLGRLLIPSFVCITSMFAEEATNVEGGKWGGDNGTEF